jgi:[ribosomal protein S5]-alanine N-acetyltransferase
VIGNWNGLITTPRLILKPVQTQDLPALFEYAQDPRVSLYTMWEPHESLQETRDFFNDYISPNNQVGVAEPLGIFLRDQPDTLIGTVGAFYSSEAHRCKELAYALHPKFWGQGIIVEAAISLLDWCLAHYEIARLQCRCKAPNHASRRVMEKIGFVYEGTKRESLRHRGQYWDMLEYSILPREWIRRYPQKLRIIRSAQAGNADDLWTWHGLIDNQEVIKVQALLSLDETHAEIMSVQSENPSTSTILIKSVIETLQIHGINGVSVNTDLFKQKSKLFLCEHFDPSGFRSLSQSSTTPINC